MINSWKTQLLVLGMQLCRKALAKHVWDPGFEPRTEKSSVWKVRIFWIECKKRQMTLCSTFLTQAHCRSAGNVRLEAVRQDALFYGNTALVGKYFCHLDMGLLFCFLLSGDMVSLCSPRLFWDSLCRPGWPQTHRDPPASSSQILELKVCTIMPYSWVTFI